jgi:hypothetical protein
MTENIKLKEWLKLAGNGLTKIEEPIYIAASAEAELRGYHPVELPACRFAMALHESGEYAVMKDADGDWLNGDRSKLLDVHKSLKLRLVEDPERDDYLHDADVEGKTVMFGPSDWRVTEWKLFRFKDSTGSVKFLRDEIKWENGSGDVAFSFYDWKPYIDR